MCAVWGRGCGPQGPGVPQPRPRGQIGLISQPQGTLSLPQGCCFADPIFYVIL